MPDVLTTLALVKGWLRIPPSNTGDDLNLQALVNAVNTDFLSQISRQSILAKPYTEIRDGNGKDRMVLRQYPVQAVSLVQVGPYVLLPYNPFAASQTLYTGFLINSSAFVSVGGYTSDEHCVSLQGYLFQRGRQNVKFGYVGGYVAQGSATQNVPVSPYQVQVSGPASGIPPSAPFVGDQGVTYANGTALTPLTTPGTPGVGQYAVSSTGLYTFAAGDSGQSVTINFIYQAAPADVTQACTEWAAFRYQAKDRGNKRSIVTETHLQTTFDTRAMPDTVKDVIEQYMRRGMMGT
jgi:hypothetical protein